MLEKFGTILRNLPEAPWYPQTGPQSLTYISEADEVFFGGAAGGGKSDLLYGLARTAHVNSLILRLESTQLTGFKHRVQEQLQEGDRWQGIGSHGGILRTNDGRIMEFSGCDSFGTANTKFRGRAHDLKGWDELPTFSQQVYEFVNAWNRTSVPGQRCRVVGAGNPPGKPEEEWVLNYWAPWLKDFNMEPGELAWYVRLEDEFKQVDGPTPIVFKGNTYYPRSRTFIPARLEDNPILESTGYRQTLQMLPSPLREQLLYGDMRIGLSDDAHQLIPTAWIDAAMKRWKYKEPRDIDLSATAIDAARGGDDRMIMAQRYGTWMQKMRVWPGRLVPDGPRAVAACLLNIQNVWTPIILDLGGTAGGGLFDSFRLLQPDLPTYAFVGASASEYRDKSGRIKMRNKRTESYWRMRDALDPTTPEDEQLALPPDDELRNELAATRWYMFTNGAGCEDKDDIIKRIGRSPDKADAATMTMMDGHATAGWINSPATVLQTPGQFMGGDDPGKRAYDTRLDNRWG